MNEPSKQDIKYIQKCIQLSEESYKHGDKPFACLIVKNKEVLVKSLNKSIQKTSDHAEILAMDKAMKLLGSKDLSQCILYSNCEPCPMCSFMIREYKIKKVIFAIRSSFMGGYTKWKILQDNKLSKCKPFFSSPPEVIPYVMEDEAKKVFDKAGLWMFGKDSVN